MSGVA